MTEAIRRAERAKVLLADELIVEARAHMRESLTRAMWRRAELTDADQAKLDALTKHFDTYFAWFDRVIQDGKLAEIELQERGRVTRLRERLRQSI